MRIFRKKNVKFKPSNPRLQTQTPALLLPPTTTTLSSSFLALNAFLILTKQLQLCSTFASSALLRLFFTSNSAVFDEEGCKNISCPRAQGTLATSLTKVWKISVVVNSDAKLFNLTLWFRSYTVMQVCIITPLRKV